MTTMLETLNETAGAYTSKTRATNHHGHCCYFTEGNVVQLVGAWKTPDISRIRLEGLPLLTVSMDWKHT